MGTADHPVPVLLHKRRVTEDMARGNVPAAVCEDCLEAFSSSKPWLCKFALANDLWLGRPDPLLWKANITHDMCLALARTVATKVVLRAGGAAQRETSSRSGSSWDYAFHQSGLVGSAVVFHNGDAEYALQSLPPCKLNDALAVSFCVDLPSADAQEACRATVSRIRQLHLHRQEFVEQAEALRATNPVYRSGVSDINRELLAEWFGNEDHIFAMSMFVLRVLQRFQPRCRSLLFHLRSSTASLLFPLAKLGRVLFVKPDLPRRLKLVSRPDRRRPSVAICRRPVSWPWSRRFRILILVAGKFQ